MVSKTQEAAVRNYLQALKEPESLRDDTAIADVQTRLENSDDPLERVRLRAQIDQAQRRSGDGIVAMTGSRHGRGRRPVRFPPGWGSAGGGQAVP